MHVNEPDGFAGCGCPTGEIRGVGRIATPSQPVRGRAVARGEDCDWELAITNSERARVYVSSGATGREVVQPALLSPCLNCAGKPERRGWVGRSDIVLLCWVSDEVEESAVRIEQKIILPDSCFLCPMRDELT